MKKAFFISGVILWLSLPFLSILLIYSCKNIRQNEGAVKDKEDAQTALSKTTDAAGRCTKVCNVSKFPDLQIVTNAELNPPETDIVDSSTYFFQKYHVRVFPIRLTQNYVTPGFYTLRYGWDSLVTVNRVTLQCLIENIAPYDSTCQNDWEFNESQGTLVGPNVFFDGLFLFDTYERGNGNNWKFLYTDFKKEFFPSNQINQPYLFSYFCYYDRAIQAQQGDFYNNPFRLPNHDGLYKIVIKFNPVIKGCRAVVETNYTNNEKTIILEIINGSVKINTQ